MAPSAARCTDFAVAVLYDADNLFEHPSIRYLPDFNFAGLTLNFSLLYTDSLQPIDSPKFNWIDWATLDVVREDGTTTNGVSLWDNAMLADATFPAASATVNVVAGANLQLNNSLSLWYENLAFTYTAPGGLGSSTTFFFQKMPYTASISVGSNTYTYSVTTPTGEDGSTIAAGLAVAAAAGPIRRLQVPPLTAFLVSRRRGSEYRWRHRCHWLHSLADYGPAGRRHRG